MARSQPKLKCSSQTTTRLIQFDFWSDVNHYMSSQIKNLNGSVDAQMRNAYMYLYYKYVSNSANL
jgi:hypothetical protein